MARTLSALLRQNNPKTSNNLRSQDIKATDNSTLTADLARWTVVFAFGGIALLGFCAIVAAAAPGLIYVLQRQGAVSDVKEGFANIKDILSLLLPVMSAWAGTVFAFYFGKENFKAGTDSSAALVRQLTSEEKLQSISAREVMIKIEDADRLILEKEPKEIKLKADIIDAILNPKKRERLPILDKDGNIKYMAHRSLLDKFIAQKADGEKKVTNLTLNDMLQDETFGKILRDSYCVIAETSSLADAKKLMETIDYCSDIFITADGKSTSKVIGWITDVIVRQQSTI